MSLQWQQYDKDPQFANADPIDFVNIQDNPWVFDDNRPLTLQYAVNYNQFNTVTLRILHSAITQQLDQADKVVIFANKAQNYQYVLTQFLAEDFVPDYPLKIPVNNFIIVNESEHEPDKTLEDEYIQQLVDQKKIKLSLRIVFRSSGEVCIKFKGLGNLNTEQILNDLTSNNTNASMNPQDDPGTKVDKAIITLDDFFKEFQPEEAPPAPVVDPIIIQDATIKIPHKVLQTIHIRQSDLQPVLLGTKQSVVTNSIEIKNPTEQEIFAVNFLIEKDGQCQCSSNRGLLSLFKLEQLQGLQYEANDNKSNIPNCKFIEQFIETNKEKLQEIPSFITSTRKVKENELGQTHPEGILITVIFGKPDFAALPNFIDFLSLKTLSTLQQEINSIQEEQSNKSITHIMQIDQLNQQYLGFQYKTLPNQLNISKEHIDLSTSQMQLSMQKEQVQVQQQSIQLHSSNDVQSISERVSKSLIKGCKLPLLNKTIVQNLHLMQVESQVFNVVSDSTAYIANLQSKQVKEDEASNVNTILEKKSQDFTEKKKQISQVISSIFSIIHCTDFDVCKDISSLSWLGDVETMSCTCGKGFYDVMIEVRSLVIYELNAMKKKLLKQENVQSISVAQCISQSTEKMQKQQQEFNKSKYNEKVDNNFAIPHAQQQYQRYIQTLKQQDRKQNAYLEKEQTTKVEESIILKGKQCENCIANSNKRDVAQKVAEVNQIMENLSYKKIPEAMSLEQLIQNGQIKKFNDYQYYQKKVNRSAKLEPFDYKTSIANRIPSHTRYNLKLPLDNNTPLSDDQINTQKQKIIESQNILHSLLSQQLQILQNHPELSGIVVDLVSTINSSALHLQQILKLNKSIQVQELTSKNDQECIQVEQVQQIEKEDTDNKTLSRHQNKKQIAEKANKANNKPEVPVEADTQKSTDNKNKKKKNVKNSENEQIVDKNKDVIAVQDEANIQRNEDGEVMEGGKQTAPLEFFDISGIDIHGLKKKEKPMQNVEKSVQNDQKVENKTEQNNIEKSIEKVENPVKIEPNLDQEDEQKLEKCVDKIEKSSNLKADVVQEKVVQKQDKGKWCNDNAYACIYIHNNGK